MVPLETVKLAHLQEELARLLMVDLAGQAPLSAPALPV